MPQRNILFYVFLFLLFTLVIPLSETQFFRGAQQLQTNIKINKNVFTINIDLSLILLFLRLVANPHCDGVREHWHDCWNTYLEVPGSTCCVHNWIEYSLVNLYHTTAFLLNEKLILATDFVSYSEIS